MIIINSYITYTKVHVYYVLYKAVVNTNFTQQKLEINIHRMYNWTYLTESNLKYLQLKSCTYKLISNALEVRLNPSYLRERVIAIEINSVAFNLPARLQCLLFYTYSIGI